MPFTISIVDLSSGEVEEIHVNLFSQVVEVLEDHRQVLHNHVVTITPQIDSERIEEIE